MKKPLKLGIAFFITVCIGVVANVVHNNGKCEQQLNKTEKELVEANELLKVVNYQDPLRAFLDPSVQEKFGYFETVTSKELNNITDFKVCGKSRTENWLVKNQKLLQDTQTNFEVYNSMINLVKSFKQ